MAVIVPRIECLVDDRPIERPKIPLDVAPRYSLRQLFLSHYHACWYRLGVRLAWSRGPYRERPAEQLQNLSGIQQERMASLRRRFRIRFEQRVDQVTALKQYDYLDILDQAWSAWRLPHSTGGVVQDVGSSNFWYAAVLHAFFRPTEMVGIEVEGHRIYINGYSRLDYAHGYIQNLPNTEFFVGDYACYNRPADVVTAWYPFVTPDPVLAWRMPLSVLTPGTVFSQVARNLQPHGLFIMVNQGKEEAAIAAAWCEKVGLARYGTCTLKPTLRSRIPAVASCWMLSQSLAVSSSLR